MSKCHKMTNHTFRGNVNLLSANDRANAPVDLNPQCVHAHQRYFPSLVPIY